MLSWGCEIMNAFDEPWTLLLLKQSITKGSHSEMLIIAEENPDDDEAGVKSMLDSFPNMSEEQAMSSLKEARDYNEQHMQEEMSTDEVTFPDINSASPQEMMDGNPNAHGQMSDASGNLPGAEPPKQKNNNPLNLSMDRLNELQQQYPSQQEE